MVDPFWSTWRCGRSIRKTKKLSFMLGNSWRKTHRNYYQIFIKVEKSIFYNHKILFLISCAIIIRNAKKRHKADFQIRADVYTPMFLCDLVNFFVLMFGFSAFSVSLCPDQVHWWSSLVADVANALSCRYGVRNW